MMKRTVSTLFELPREDDPSNPIPSPKRNARSSSNPQGEESMSSAGSRRGIGEVLVDLFRRKEQTPLSRSDFRSRLVLIDKAPPGRPPTPSLLGSFSARSRMNLTTNHFLKSCFRCKKDFVTHDQDIFMYRCKTFCSSDCRHHQMNLDEREVKLSQRVATAAV